MKRALFADPAHFDVVYEINPHMRGMVGNVDRALARRQWETVVETYRELGYDCQIVPAEPGLPDLCFVANQSFPVGGDRVVLSRMHAAERRPEVDVLARWYRSHGWEVLGAECSTTFEAMGDAIWHPGQAVLYGGYGFRTKREAYAERAALFGVEVVELELVDERFYHLDTCFSPLDGDTALVVPVAFSDEAMGELLDRFEVLLECPEDEAVGFLACNGHCPDQRHFIVDAGATETMALVQEAGFSPIGVDTSEFRKSGGSVQCLKLMLDEAPVERPAGSW